MAGKTTNICRTVLLGNLTQDPELRSLPSGTSVCKLRIACNTPRKDPSTGEWGTKPNYFNIVVWGGQGEVCAKYLRKGRPVAVDGRLDWREWETKDNQKREAIEIVADQVQFLNERGEAGPEDFGDEPEFEPVPAAASGAMTGADDDIPF
ncbi:MAG: single-stranded DNA-binding protein [Solirubrobacteraceae bacterium]